MGVVDGDRVVAVEAADVHLDDLAEDVVGAVDHDVPLVDDDVVAARWLTWMVSLPSVPLTTWRQTVALARVFQTGAASSDRAARTALTHTNPPAPPGANRIGPALEMRAWCRVPQRSAQAGRMIPERAELCQCQSVRYLTPAARISYGKGCGRSHHSRASSVPCFSLPVTVSGRSPDQRRTSTSASGAATSPERSRARRRR